MNNFIFENSTKVFFGKGCVKEYLCCLTKAYGDTVMLCYGGGSIKKNGIYGLRKFTFGNNGVESTHDALIKYQAMTFGFNITLFCIRSKPSFSSGQTPAYSSWLCF